ncbi:MAG: Flp pilus assembly complex ATPase component TadA [Deltaproteobacteria bacterium]|nr:Flp pilus assembly complex ATPase component TadA [Deltaproteobacteria bacterium]
MDSELFELMPKGGIHRIKEIKDEYVDPAMLEKVSLSYVKKNMVMPLKVKEGHLLVALAGPRGIFTVSEIERLTGFPVKPVFAGEKQILDAINRFYDRLSGSAQEVMDGMSGESIQSITNEWEEPKDLLDLADEAPIIRLLNSLLFRAVKDRASDIHIEPYEKEVEVRYRIDGVLKDVYIRVSVIPTSYGERIVLRILDRKSDIIGLDMLGLTPTQVKALEGLLTRSSGIILATGPTGSGKTTTLYSAINSINSTVRNIITVEDPVEYQLKGIGQVHVNPKIGLTFAHGLRSILRQDPDVIMIGEIRDSETAEIAIQASLTGHLVLSTLHTNDTASAITRLVDMGIEPFLVASSLSGVLAQRLIRVLCPACKKPYEPTTEETRLFKTKPSMLYSAAGCEKCFSTGYYGRRGIFEFLVPGQEMRPMILKNQDGDTLKRHAVSKGMRTMMEDGLEKAAEGITSLEEVLRVTRDEE